MIDASGCDRFIKYTTLEFLYKVVAHTDIGLQKVMYCKGRSHADESIKDLMTNGFVSESANSVLIHTRVARVEAIKIYDLISKMKYEINTQPKRLVEEFDITFGWAADFYERKENVIYI